MFVVTLLFVTFFMFNNNISYIKSVYATDSFMSADEFGIIWIKVSVCDIIEMFYDNQHDHNYLNIVQDCNGPGISIIPKDENIKIIQTILNNCENDFTNILCFEIISHKVMVHGIDPNPHEFYTSSHGIFVQIEPGNYHITQEGIDDYGDHNVYCNGDILQLGNYGGSLTSDKTLNFCTEFSKDCAGTINSGETKVCEIVIIEMDEILEI